MGAVKQRVLAAIQKASQSAGVDFSYLLNKAEQESGLDPRAKASTSSATGLYQFIEQTWLKTVKESGAKYGLEAAADKISIGADGVARVSGAADKKAILALRDNPEISAQMAAELTKQNKQALESKLGEPVGATELYLAHFLGANGAGNLLSAMQSNPNAKAAAILPQAANANKNVFYDSTGRAKSVSEIYEKFAAKFEGGTSARVASQRSSDDNVLARQIATASVAGSSSGSSYTFKNGVTIDKTISSPFATMMLAQMDMDVFGYEALDNAETMSRANEDNGGEDEKRRKSGLSVLAAAG